MFNSDARSAEAHFGVPAAAAGFSYAITSTGPLEPGGRCTSRSTPGLGFLLFERGSDSRFAPLEAGTGGQG